MDIRHAPMLLPAAGFAAGAALALSLTSVSVPLLVILAALGLALGRRPGVLLAALAAGAATATLRLDLPSRAVERVDPGRPSEVVARIAGHPRRDDDGWSAPVRIERLRQGRRVETAALGAVLHLPEDAPPPPYGSRVRAKGYLRRAPAYGNRLPTRPGHWRLRVKSRSFLAVEDEPGPVARLSGALRARAEAAMVAATGGGSDPHGAALARAMVLGDASRLPREWARGLRLSGLAHVLSVSGLHVGMVAGLVLLLGRRLPRRARLLLALAVIGLYLLLVGPLPALVRSSVMALLAAAALFVERPPAAPNALGWAVLLLLVDRPDLVAAPAFQLTVSATAGLLLLAPVLTVRWQRWQRLPALVRDGLAASVGAQVAALPFTLPLFHAVSFAAPLANLAAVPWTALALAGSLAWTAIAWVEPAAAAALAPGLDALAAPFGWPARVRPALWLAVPVAAGSALAWLLAAAAALLLLLPLPRRAGRLLVVGLLALACRGGAPAGPPSLELTVLDVGQGDAILLRDGRRAVLVDGGGWPRGDIGGRVLLPALAAEGVSRLDALVMTHPDRDHCGGLVDIAAYLPVAEVWSGPGWEPEGCAARFLATPGARHRVLWAGDRLAVGRWSLAVLGPEPGERRGANDRSLVLLAEGHSRRILLTGDVEAPAELRLVENAGRAGSGLAILDVDVLKVAHHGSKTSTTEALLAAATPRLALISVGEGNPYHHPSPTVLARLAARGVPTLDTARAGMIHLEVRADGRLRISTPGAPK